MLNAAVNNSPEAKQLWATPGWLPEEIGVIVDQGQFFCYQGEDLKLHIQRRIHHIIVYSLIGVAADIDSGQHQKSHLVSLVNGKLCLDLPIALAHESQWPIRYRTTLEKVNGIFLMTFWSGRSRRKRL